MNINRMKGLLMHEFYITRYSFEVINDILVYPVFSIIVFGFMTLYMTGFAGEIVAGHILAGFLLWQIINITQYSISIGCLWDVWSRNLTNVFISPVSNAEYIMSYAISGTLKSLVVMSIAGFICIWVFGFNIFGLGAANLALYFINLAFFGFGFSILVLGMIFRFGTRVSSFSWGLINFIQPLMGVAYPVSILPEPFRSIAYIFPPTYIFEAARINIGSPEVQWGLISKAFMLNAVFLTISVLFFNRMFYLSRKSGQFARLEG